MSLGFVSPGQQPSATHYNQLVRAVNALLAMTGDGIVKVQATPSTVKLSVSMDQVAQRLPVGGGVVYSAKVQDIDPTSDSTTFSVKLYAGAAEVGDAFDVYAMWDKSSIALEDYTPTVDDDVIVPITQNQDGDWYLVWGLHVSGSSIAVYARQSNHASSGTYYCYLQKYDNDGIANANTTNVIVLNLGEIGGSTWEFSGTDYFIALFPANANGIVLAVPAVNAHVYDDT